MYINNIYVYFQYRNKLESTLTNFKSLPQLIKKKRKKKEYEQEDDEDWRKERHIK